MKITIKKKKISVSSSGIKWYTSRLNDFTKERQQSAPFRPLISDVRYTFHLVASNVVAHKDIRQDNLRNAVENFHGIRNCNMILQWMGARCLTHTLVCISPVSSWTIRGHENSINGHCWCRLEIKMFPKINTAQVSSSYCSSAFWIGRYTGLSSNIGKGCFSH